MYKAAVVSHANASFKIQDIQLKPPGENEVLLKVLACGVCHTDLSIVKGHLVNVFPRVAGHEIVGDAVAVGEGVKNIAVGDRIGASWHGGHDGSCLHCQRGQFEFCLEGHVNGLSRDRGFAEYALVRAECVVRVPPDMDAAQASPILCAGQAVFNRLRKMHIEPGSLVAIQGLGGLGHLAVQYANKMGYEVAVLSSGADKETFALQLGADHYINTKVTDANTALLRLGGAALIVQTAPNPQDAGAFLRGLVVGGKLSSLAPVGPAEFDTLLMVEKRLSIHGMPGGHAVDAEEAIRFAQKHNIVCMVEKYRLADIQLAVENVLAGKARFRNVIVNM